MAIKDPAEAEGLMTKADYDLFVAGAQEE